MNNILAKFNLHLWQNLVYKLDGISPFFLFIFLLEILSIKRDSSNKSLKQKGTRPAETTTNGGGV